MKEIKLTQGQITLVDNEDFDYLSQWKWYANKLRNGSFRAIRTTNSGKVYMHRVIMNTPTDLVVDHIDHNTLNNQRSNLRNCTYQQNSQNMQRNLGESYYKGVCWDKQNKKWLAQIRVNGKHINLGRFKVEEEAVLMYNKTALQYFKEFAYISII